MKRRQRIEAAETAKAMVEAAVRAAAAVWVVVVAGAAGEAAMAAAMVATAVRAAALAVRAAVCPIQDTAPTSHRSRNSDRTAGIARRLGPAACAARMLIRAAPL